MKLLHKALSSVLLFGLLSLFSSCANKNQTAQQLSLEQLPNAQTVTFNIQGFSCQSCANGLAGVLKKTTGIYSVQASYLNGNVIVTFDNKKITTQKISQIITDDAGYLVISSH